MAEERFDVVVVGSGGGLIGAYAAAARGLRTLVIEKTEFIGGTTAYSGAGLWLPGNAAQRRKGAEDGPDIAGPYLDAIVGDDSPASLRRAFLQAAPRMIDELEASPWFQWFWWARGIPDYFADVPGSFEQGRTVFPPDLPRAALGDLEPLLRRPIWTERFGVDPGPTLDGGQALIARALLAFTETGNGTVRTNTAFQRLIVEDGAVVGVEALSDGNPVTFRAARGVLLAAGGYEHNAELRHEYGQPVPDDWTSGCPGNTGDALLAAVEIGAGTALLDEAWYATGVVTPEGRPAFYSSVRTGIWVDADGRRFMNENLPYDRAGHEMVRLGNTTAKWVFDHRQVGLFDQLPTLPPVPGWFDVDEWLAAGVLQRADTLGELAELIDVPPATLTATVEQFNEFARTGVDEAFHRGRDPWDRSIHRRASTPLPADVPNPCLVPLEQPPFYAVTVGLTDLGTKGGLTTDERARVLRTDGSVIEGLYASGNTMAPVTGRIYPGAGGPVASSMVFSYLAALDMAGA